MRMDSRYDRPYFIDHNTRSTTYDDPRENYQVNVLCIASLKALRTVFAVDRS